MSVEEIPLIHLELVFMPGLEFDLFNMLHVLCVKLGLGHQVPSASPTLML
jgi:hypothetical protein